MTPISGTHDQTVPNTPKTLSGIQHGLQAGLRRDGLVILLYGLATLIMTYPLVFKLGQEWLGSYDADTFVKLWDNYWLSNLLSTSQSPFYTTALFYPTGLDLSFHSISWAVSGFSWLITPLLGRIDAYNITILLAVFITAYAGYLLVQSLVSHRAAAWLGGAVYSFAPYHMAHTGGHPDLVHLAPVPLAVLFLTVALTRSSKRAALGGALAVGAAALISLYIMDFTLLTLVPVFIFLALEQGRWRRRRFWVTAVLFASFSLLFLLPRLYPIFRNPNTLSYAIESKYAADQGQTDLLAYVIPSRHNPLFAPFVDAIAARFNMNRKWPAYLGVAPILLTGLALTGRKQRRLALFWSGVGVLFVLLSLGTVLQFNGEAYEGVVMPARYLAWFPPIRAVARPDFFVLGALLPLAVCVALGLERWLDAWAGKKRARVWLPVLLSIWLLFEYWNGPYPGAPAAVNPFYQQLASQTEDFALIELPMGRQPSKPYVYYQTVHHKPIVEGLSARTPAGSYRYITQNELLLAWRHQTALDCNVMPDDVIRAQIERLMADDFRYVLVHYPQGGSVPDAFAGYLTAVPAYRDDTLAAYALADLYANLPCEGEPAAK